MRPTPTRLACAAYAVLSGLMTATAVQAQTSVSAPSAAVAPGAQVATCASLNGGGNGLSITGLINSGLQAAGTQCTSQVVGGISAVAGSDAQFSSGTALATAHAEASLGALKLNTSLTTPGGGDVRFPVSIAQASFVARMTPNAPGLLGQNVFLLVPIHVSGSLHASGNAGSAAFSVQLLKNDFSLSSANPGYVVGTGNQVSTDRQAPTWRVASYPVPGPLVDNETVDETVVFSVPVTIGTSFELTVAGLSIASTRNQTGGGESFSDFAHTVQWLGATQVRLANGTLVDVNLVDGDTGINWGLAASVPEPSTWALFTAGLLALGSRPGRAALSKKSRG